MATHLTLYSSIVHFYAHQRLLVPSAVHYEVFYLVFFLIIFIELFDAFNKTPGHPEHVVLAPHRALIIVVCSSLPIPLFLQSICQGLFIEFYQHLQMALNQGPGGRSCLGLGLLSIHQVWGRIWGFI